MRAVLLLACLGLVGTGCSLQRAAVAEKARLEVVGMSKADVLSCMGPPVNRATEGDVEVWSYYAGGETSGGGTATAVDLGSGVTTVVGAGSAAQRYCIVNVRFDIGTVAAVTYVGPTGGLLTPDDQCAYAVRECVAD